jgi:S1-C subfamily serine protease
MTHERYRDIIKRDDETVDDSGQRDRSDAADAETDSEYREGALSGYPSVKRRITWILAVLIISACAGFAGGLLALVFGPSWLTNSQGAGINIETESNINTAQAVAEKVMPSVVGISTQVISQTIFGQSLQQGVGTGVIVDANGYILTNSHVVNDGNTRAIIVYLYDGRELTGEVLWNDTTIDLAIVKIEASQLHVAELGDSEEIRVGQFAVAIGNPLGFAFERSVTAGIISGLNRSIPVTANQTIDGLIQTDASINPGNSGGPLLNAAGEVVGINTAKIQTGEGLGFAVPINIAKPIVEEVKEKGQFNRAYIGIQGINLSEVRDMYPEEDFSVEAGVYVYQVFEDSPAKNAGLMEHDIIVRLGDAKVDNMSQLTKELFTYRPGDTVEIEIVRDGGSMMIEVVLIGIIQE